MNKDDIIINIEHLSKAFGEKVVLDDINLYIKNGEFVTLLGPSGCGKTTLLRIIGGFASADSGRVTLDGKDLSGMPPYERPLNTVSLYYMYSYIRR